MNEEVRPLPSESPESEKSQNLTSDKFSSPMGASIPSEVKGTPGTAPEKKAVTGVDITQVAITRVGSEEQKSILKPTVVDEGMDRRTFIKWSTVGWAAFAAIVGGYGTMLLRFFFPNVLFEPKQSFRAGLPSEYQSGEVSTRWKDRHGVWIVRDSEKIYALSTVCTHLGCTPNWLENEAKFKCPCHGSGFYKSGINFEGPAPRPLERFKIGLTDDGEILVDKTAKFQQEKGEWNDPDSFLLA